MNYHLTPIGRVRSLRRSGRSYSGSAETRGHSPLPCGIGATPTSRGFTLTWANPLESLGGRVIVICRDTQPNTSGRLRTQSAGVIIHAVTQRQEVSTDLIYLVDRTNNPASIFGSKSCMNKQISHRFNNIISHSAYVTSVCVLKCTGVAPSTLLLTI